MAKHFNRSRMHISWIIAVVTMISIILLKPISSPDEALHETLDTIGLMLVSICALGRIYSSAFLGGYKNQKLINYGPFSIVRNPLYVFSLLGFTGLALTSMITEAMLLVPLSFIILYHFLIRREENFLKEQFGEEYKDYMKKVPRLFPNFKLWTVPELVEVKPKFILNAALGLNMVVYRLLDIGKH